MKIVHNIDTERETSRLAAVPVAKPSDDPGVMECPNALRAGTSRPPHIADSVAFVAVTRGGFMKKIFVISLPALFFFIFPPGSAAPPGPAVPREKVFEGRGGSQRQLSRL